MWWWLACFGPVVESDTPTDTDVIDSDTPAPIPFQPALDGHPRLVARPEDLGAIQARWRGESDDPKVSAAWTMLADHLRASCATAAPTVEADPIDLGAMRTAAAIARNCAMIAWIDGDSAAAEKAANILLQQPINANDLGDPQSDVHLWTALGLEAEAVDLLLATGFVDADAVSAPVIALARTSYQRFVLDEALYFKISQSNHNLKFAGAIGLCGLLFDDDPEAAAWIAVAQQQIWWLLANDQLTTNEGGYGEGPYYQMYADFQVIPYLRAWHRAIGTGEHDFQAACTILPIEACPASGFHRIGDLWDDPQIQAMWRWNVAIRMPDGRRFPFDDSVPTGHPSALLAEIDPIFGWDWMTQGEPLVEWAGDVSAELLATWDGRNTEPTSPTCWTSPTTGTAVLASDRGPGATWAMLLGESTGPMTPTGHEHPDAGTFGMWANGTWFVIDPGYAGWTQREPTASYADHAGVVIDEAGPRSGYLNDLSTEWTAVDGCAAQIAVTVEDARWTRRIRVEGQAVVVEDRVGADSEHDYTWRLPLLTGDDRGTVELHDWGAVVRRPTGDLAVAISGIETIGAESRPDALTYGGFLTHDVLVADTSATDVNIFWVLAPIPTGSTPTVSLSADAIAINGVTWTAELE
jgi:hypothetical protein